MGRSGLAEQQLGQFANEVWMVICEEWPTEERRLESAAIRERLEE